MNKLDCRCEQSLRGQFYFTRSYDAARETLSDDDQERLASAVWAMAREDFLTGQSSVVPTPNFPASNPLRMYTAAGVAIVFQCGSEDVIVYAFII